MSVSRRKALTFVGTDTMLAEHRPGVAGRTIGEWQHLADVRLKLAIRIPNGEKGALCARRKQRESSGASRALRDATRPNIQSNVCENSS